MANNIEIKARVNDFEELRGKVEALCGTPGSLLCQKDVFYRFKRYRLKLRNVNGNSELILYDRENTSNPKPSRYLRLPIRFPKAVHAILSTVLGLRGTIEKKRTLFFSGQTRIHLDEVNRLDTFLEFEVVLDEDTPADAGVTIANNLIEHFEIRKEDLISGSYIDLMESACPKHPASR